MSQMSEVIGLLALTDRQFERAKHRLRRTKITLYLLLSPLYILSIGIAVSAIVRLWQGYEPLQFWVLFMPVLPLAMSIAAFISAFSSDSRTPLYPPITALRDAIRTGDATLAPIAPDDAAPTLSPSPLSPTRIGPLRRPMQWSHPLIVFASSLLLVAVVAVPILCAYISIQAGMLLGVALLLLATISYMLAYRAFGSVYMRIDAGGLRWPAPLGGHHRLAWRDAQALIQVGDVRLFLYDRKRTFILYSAERVFSWNITDSSRQQRERAVTQSLLRAISLHAGLPLRDISTEARRLAYDLTDPLTVRKATPQEHKYRDRVYGVVLLPFIIMTLVAGAAQITEPFYFEHLYTQSHATTPLYADPLTHQDNDWPETNQAHFTGTSYTVTHDLALFGFHSSLILPPRRYNNALYEVTARAYGGTNAGLAIRGTRSSLPILAFYASPEGDWWLEQDILDGKFHDHLFTRLGNSTAIQRDPGAPNHIGILVQGSDFTFFINGHYITRYHDDHLAGGNVGLYLDPEDGQGSFTDFAVYPA